MQGKNGMLSRIRFYSPPAILFAYRKQKRNLLIPSFLKIFVQVALTLLTISSQLDALSSPGSLKGSLFFRNKIYSNDFGLSLEFISSLNGAQWILTYVYGPCTGKGKILFMN